MKSTFLSPIGDSARWAGFLLLGCCGLPLLAATSEPLPECPQPVVLQGPAPKATAGSDSLIVVSLNTHEETRSNVLLEGLDQKPELKQADVLLLQEFVDDQDNLLIKLSEALNYHYVFASTQSCGDACHLGLAILSRYPLSDYRVLPLPQNNLQFNNRCRIALTADADTPWGNVALFNLHLDTRINSRRRVRQLGPVFETAAKIASPTLIAGDFNTADFLWIKSVVPLPWLQLQKRAVRKAMAERGFSTPFVKKGITFNRFPLKLDWIFLKGLQPNRSGITRVDFSDHRALWSVFEMAGSRGGR